MPRFFIDKPACDAVTITGEDAKHISRSLRMKIGEKLTLCDKQGTDYLCEIAGLSDSAVNLNVLSSETNKSEPTVKVTLYQGLPKGDKFDSVVQKSTELGVYKIAPIIMERSVSRPNDKSCAKKVVRWQKIADEAAKQCERGILPEVEDITSFNAALDRIFSHQKVLVCYEGGGDSPASIITSELTDIALIIGPEGGISDDEIAALKNRGAQILTLGKRILRTETAPVCALSVIMLLTGNM
ncbi:MAG: 16S rRNA (uracil(1498)-N(3))-methyltransferase [Clostridia bacterium]|nr:16S rRNA (uracil(1498)-N(3))-methyltransferase [Clostridia bacterium]